LADFFKTRQAVVEKAEKYIQRVQEDKIKARATEEQILNTIMEGFLLFIQASVSNHDIEAKAASLASIKKWGLVAESFLTAVHANADNARLQRQIKELSAKLESNQMRLVNELNSPKKAVQFEDDEEAQATSSSRTASPKQSRGRSQGGGSRSSSPAPTDTRGAERQRFRLSGPSTQESEGRQSGWQPRKQKREANSGQEDVELVKKEKAENLTKDNQGHKSEEIHREGGCSLHFLGEKGGLPGVETGLVGKQQILGKTRGKIRGNIRGKTGGKIRGKIGGKLRGVIIVTTRGGVIGGLVLP